MIMNVEKESKVKYKFEKIIQNLLSEHKSLNSNTSDIPCFFFHILLLMIDLKLRSFHTLSEHETKKEE